MSWLRLAAAWVTLTAGALASQSGVAAECIADDMCEADHTCQDGICVGPEVDAPVAPRPSCMSDHDCSGDLLCISAACAARCGADTDCPGDELCQQSVCISASTCQGDVDCPGDWLCQQQTCGPPGSPVAAPAPLATEVLDAPSLPLRSPAPETTSFPEAPHSKPASRDESATGTGGTFKLIAGASLFASTWLLSIPITAAASDGSNSGGAAEFAAIPLAGPLLIIENRALTDGGTAMYVAVAALQWTGVAIALWGAIEGNGSPQSDGDTGISLRVAPLGGPDHLGGILAGAF